MVDKKFKCRLTDSELRIWENVYSQLFVQFTMHVIQNQIDISKETVVTTAIDGANTAVRSICDNNLEY